MNLVLVSLACILATSQAQNFTELMTDLAPRIAGGRNARPGEFPYQVSLQVGSSPTRTSHFCGGSIIRSNWVLTAAHCVALRSRVPRNSIFVAKAGKVNLERNEVGEQTSIYEKSILHERYTDNGKVGPYDIGLVKLRTPFRFSRTVLPVQLPPPNVEFAGTGTVSGWGKTSNDPKSKPTPANLQAVQLPIIDRRTCQKMVGNAVDQTNLCCGPQSTGKTTCQGDSGGPLVAFTNGRRLLIGAVSWGPSNCGTPPSVFARVSFFVGWINRNIARN